MSEGLFRHHRFTVCPSLPRETSEKIAERPAFHRGIREMNDDHGESLAVAGLEENFEAPKRSLVVLRGVFRQAGFEALAAEFGGFAGAALFHEGFLELADALLEG